MAQSPKTDRPEVGGLLRRPDAWTLISEIYWMSYKLLERRLWHLGITASQARVLALLDVEGRPMHPSTIAVVLFQETQSITGILNRMEDRGWVQRKPDATDRRAVCVDLTQPGSKLAAEIREASDELYRDLFAAALSGTERKDVERALKKVRDGGFQLPETDFKLRRAQSHALWSE